MQFQLSRVTLPVSFVFNERQRTLLPHVLEWHTHLKMKENKAL